MSKSFNLIYVAVGIILVSLIIPTIIWLRDFYIDFDSKIDTAILSDYAAFQMFVISFWGLILNLILVWIGYKAFKNFDVKKQFLNKQLTLVTELAAEITSTTLSISIYKTVKNEYEEEAVRVVTSFTLSFFEMSLGLNLQNIDLICIRGNNIENLLPFLRHRNNPVLPSLIAEKLKKLHKYFFLGINVLEEELPKTYAILYSKNSVEDNYSKILYKYYDNPSGFRADSEDLRLSIINWLKEFGADDINI